MLRRFWRHFRARAIHIFYYLIPIIVICSCISISFYSEDSQAPKDEDYDLQGQREPPGPARFSQNTLGSQGSILTRGRENGYNYSDVLVIFNGNSGLSIKIAKYFQNARNIPELNMLNLTGISAAQTVSRTVFDDIRGQIEAHLDNNNLTDKINYFVTTKGVPLRVSGGSETNACLDNELTLIKGNHQGYIGNTRWLINPYFEDNEPFSKSKYDLYLVTRLTGFTWPEIKRLIDNATASAGMRGTYVLDEDATKGYTGGYGIGNVWIRDANTILTAKGEQTYYDNTDTFVTGQSNVMGYASWGSNDAHHRANRLQNPDFEASMLIPTNWDVLTDSGITDNVSVNKSVRYSYQNSLMINRTAISSNFSGVAQNFSLVPEVRYWLRGRVNITSKSGPGGAHLQMRVLDVSDNILRIINSNIRTSVTNGWVTFSQRIYEPIPGAVKLRILAVLNQSSGVVFFDQITLFDILPHNKWLPGAIAETFVSTGGRSFNYGTSYGQSLVADLIRDGVTGVKGYVYEPYLSAIAHPDILFDRFTDGYNLAESYYMASNFLGWMDVVVGDPKMAPYADVLPDLNISVHGIRLTPEIPNDEQEITVNYTVTNLGEPSDDEYIIKAYQIYGEFEKFITQHSLKGIEGFGTIRQFEFGFIAETPGEIKLKIIIDPDNDYKESKKNNNLAEIEIYINNLPDAQSLSVSPDQIYRTDEFVVQVQGSDVESLTTDLIPILEARTEPSGEWFEFENEQLVTQYNSSGDTWDFTITSNTSMALGKYSLRISFIDDNNAAGKYYFLHRVLEVLNNLPGMDEIIFDRTVVNRTEQIWATINVSDIETEFFELEVEAQYRFKPKDTQSPSGWLEVDYLQSSAKINWTSLFMEDFWLAMIEFDTDSKIGYYQFRARVTDIDLNASDWMYPEIDLRVLNNPPEVSNITSPGSSVYRTETLQIEVRGTDIEDEVRLSSLGCEIEYRPQNGSGSGDGQWDINYLTDIEFDFFTDSWKAVFQPPRTAQIGNYSFRARIIDTDGNYSDWAYINDSIVVMNNPPVAELSFTSMVITEDEEITLNAKKSEDIEDSESDLKFYWELSDDEGPFIVTFNETFTFTIHQEGEYQVKLRVKDTNGVTTWDGLELTVENVKPTAKIEVNIRNPQVNEIILFSATGSSDTTSDIETLIYTWDFGDDSHETGKTITINHSYSQPQRFTVTLTVTDDDGESHQATTSIIVEPKEKDGGTSETDDDYQGLYFMAGVAVIIIIIIVVLLFVMILKKKRKHDEVEGPPEMTTLEPLPLTLDQASEQSLEQPFKPPFGPEEPISQPTLAGPELVTVPTPEALTQEPSTAELPRTDDQALGTTEITTLPAQKIPTIEASQTLKLPPKTEEMPDLDKDTQTPGQTETESETDQKEVLPPPEPEEAALNQENGSDSHAEQPEDKTENEDQ